MSPRASPRFFGPDLFRFLKDLERNNNRPWFQKNKARYEATVQEPAVRFIEAMGPRLARISPYLVADPRPFGGSLSRIYRDTRFSKDKRPYKTHVGIHFSHEDATKERNLPGYFFHIGAGESSVYSGVWHPAPSDLAKIRDAIVASPTAWARVVDRGIEIDGESYVRVPAGYDAKHRFADDLRRKDFFAGREFVDRVIAGPRFVAAFEDACVGLAPLNRFLSGAMSIRW
jgi:uncharacterized protein (TIGR02453 family)